MEVSFFFKKNVETGQVEQSPLYTVFAEAMKARQTVANSFFYTEVSPVMHGYIEEQDKIYDKSGFRDAFKTIFGFDIYDFNEGYEKAEQIGIMLNSLEKAREVKAAYEYLKEKFGWKENFAIYKYDDALGKDLDGYAVENVNVFSIPGIEKIE